MATRVQKIMTQPINLIFRFLQSKQRILVWLYDQTDLRIEGRIIGFDEYMNLVLDEAEEVSVKRKTRKPLGRLLLKGDNITLMQTAIPGAAEAIQSLKASQLPLKFVTNTTTDKRDGIAQRLVSCGIPCEPEDIITPALCAALYLKQHDIGPAALFVSPNVLPDFQGCQLLPPSAEAGAAAVVLGDMGDQWQYSSLNRVFRLMMQQPCPLLLTLGKSRYYKDLDGLSLDVGPFTAAIEFATGATAVVLGKPAPSVFVQAAQSLGLQPGQVVMVGDDVMGDVGGAQAAGCRAVLVKTGKYRPGDEAGQVLPTAVLTSVAALPQWLQEHNALIQLVKK
eukprot:gene12468-12603_t